MFRALRSWLKPACTRPTGAGARRRLAIDRLEDRLVPTGLPPVVLIDGATDIVEMGTYRLNLTAVDPENDPVTGWTVNWGDGAVQTITGNPSSVDHTYADGAARVVNVTASATVGGETFGAKVSGVGTGQTTIHPATTGGLDNPTFMISGRDANGDAVGDLYVSGGDQGSSKVNAYDGATGAFIRTVVSAADGLSRPRGLAFGPDGNLYVSSALTGSVLRYDWATRTVSTFVSSGSGGLDYPGALAFGPDGNLYVAGQVGGLIFRYDGVTGVAKGQFADAPNRVADIKFGPDGALYVSTAADPATEQADNRVLRHNSATGQFETFVGERSGMLVRPGALAFGPDGDLFVVTQENDRVLRYDGQTGALLGAIAGGQEAPFGLAFGPDGDLYVSDRKTLSINSTTVDNFLAILKYEGPLNQTTAANLPVTVLDAVVSTYASSPKATIPSDLKTYTWSINVPDGGKIVDVDVALDITHPNDSDLMVWLVSPSGRRIQLINRVGGTGDNFKGTILDDEATVSIAQGPVPFTGRFRPAERLSDFDGETVQGLWKLEISDRVKSNRGTLNSWSLTITRGVGPAALMAAGAPAVASTSTLTAGRIEPLLAEALRRWEAAGVDTSALHGVDVRIADLGGNTLGLASGNTIWLDDNAAGWGWFVDPTPRSDSEFRAVGDQGEQNRIDLLSVLTHEIGHLLGHDHAEGGAMAETLAAGIRVIPEDHTQDNPQAQKGGATALTVPFTFTGGGLAPGWSQYTSDANRDLFLGTFTQTDDPVSYPVTLTYQTANGSADGSDYTAASGSLTFQPGKTRKTITITVKTDRLRESDETFFIDFTSLTPDVLGGVRGRGTILNDD